MIQKPPRPIGITILGIIEILIGVLGLLVSLLILGVSALLSTIPVVGGLASSVGLIIGGVFLFFTLIWLATGVGFLHGRGWAWDLGMIFTILSILGAAYVAYIGVTQTIYALGFWVIMIIYLTRHHVKIFFGKGFELHACYEHPANIAVCPNSPITNPIHPTKSTLNPVHSRSRTSSNPSCGISNREMPFLRHAFASRKLVLP